MDDDHDPEVARWNCSLRETLHRVFGHPELLLEHYAEEGFLDAKSASNALKSAAALAREKGQSVELSPELVELLAQHLAGELPPRRGRRRRALGSVNDSWRGATMIRSEFYARRADGEGYDALIAEYADLLKVSRSTVETMIFPNKCP